MRENIRVPADKSAARSSARIDIERIAVTFSRHVAVTYCGLIGATRGGKFGSMHPRSNRKH